MEENITTVKFELIEPNDCYIKFFNNIWNHNKMTTTKVKLFKDLGPIEILDYKCVKGNKYKENDEEIFGKFIALNQDRENLTNYIEAVDKINDYYKTQIKSGLADIAEKIHNKRNVLFKYIEEMSYDNAVNLMACINYGPDKGDTYLYSFATKFVSFLAGAVKGDLYKEKIPIFDSYSSTLLYEFLKKKKPDEKLSHSKMGLYRNYMDIYSSFVKEYNVGKNSYKEIDIFLWLYGKVLYEYWKSHAGIIYFSSPLYIEPKSLNEIHE